MENIIHIGANEGQESDMYYNKGNPKVIFIEAHPGILPRLIDRISKYENQKAIQALVTDVDGKEYDFFYDKNNAGQSCSLFDFHLHKKMFPRVTMAGTIKLIGKTLPTILKENNIKFKFNKVIKYLNTNFFHLVLGMRRFSLLQNFNKKFKNAVKIGFNYQIRKRDFFARKLNMASYQQIGGGGINFDNSLLSLPDDKIFAPNNIGILQLNKKYFFIDKV